MKKILLAGAILATILTTASPAGAAHTGCDDEYNPLDPGTILYSNPGPVEIYVSPNETFVDVTDILLVGTDTMSLDGSPFAALCVFTSVTGLEMVRVRTHDPDPTSLGRTIEVDVVSDGEVNIILDDTGIDGLCVYVNGADFPTSCPEAL